MDAEDLARTLMRKEVRRSIRLKVSDIDATRNAVLMMHSQKEKHKKARKKYMSVFVCDMKRIDT